MLSIMAPPDPNRTDYAGEVDAQDTLERVIAQSGGDTSHDYLVLSDGRIVGTLAMRSLVRALVPR